MRIFRSASVVLTGLLGLLPAAGFGASSVGSGGVPAKAEPRLLRALKTGVATLPVLVGLKEPRPSARIQRAEQVERELRRAAGRRVTSALSADDFLMTHSYQNFSILAGKATAAGVGALSDHRDVAWVMLDGEKHTTATAAFQPQIALIRSDLANAAGFTGKGQAVAVLDTGVDQNIQAIVGGFSTPEPAGPPSDCEGHGTSVASIIANLVAPDAKIVAVKVFPACQGFTFDSLILEGIDFAIANKAKFNITAINMSLGGPASEDNSDLGFCDALQPQFASSINAATKAGIAVVAASGNDGSVNRLSSPACISSAISVGATYSSAAVSVEWEGLCSDAPVAPGQPTCFSNSSSNLTLLAPGTFWDVPTAGGAHLSFSGTSAAAPAVAGVVALLRAAHPDLSVPAVVGILRGTGRRISDARKGVTTPLVDALAAVQLAPGNSANAAALPISIPDGSGSATATATVSGFTGSLGEVQAAVSIDHPDPRQLRVTLTGPDGTSVLLHDQTGKPQHPINAVYGRTEASASPLSVFRGKQANGAWTLTVEDLVPGESGRILGFSVSLIVDRFQPSEPIPPGLAGRVLPYVAHISPDDVIRSDVRLYNPSSDAKTFSLYFVRLGADGSQAVKSTRTVGPGRVLALDDVVLSEFAYEDTAGSITVASDTEDFLLGARTSNTGSKGTFSSFLPGSLTTSGLAADAGVATANGLARAGGTHAGAGFTEVSGSPVTVHMDLLDATGALLASTTRSAQANSTTIIPDIALDRGLGPTPSFRVAYTVVSAAGRILPFATVVDDATGGIGFEGAGNPPLSSQDIIVPQAAHLTAANGDFLQSSLNVTNLDTNPVTIAVSLLPLVLHGGPAVTRSYTLEPGQTLEKTGVLATEFGLADPSAAGLRIHPSSPARLAVSSRISVTRDGTTFGFLVPGAPASSAIGAGSTATAIGLDQNDVPNGSRVSFGFTEVDGADVSVTVTAKAGDTGATLGSASYAVPANTSFQTRLSDLLPAGAAASNLYLQFSVAAGAGRVMPYAVGVDRATGSTIYIPAQ